MRKRGPPAGPSGKPTGSTPAVRAGPLVALPSLLSGFGVEPAPLMIRAGLDPGALGNPENWIPADQLGVLIDACVEATNCEHFGLLVGAPFTLGSMGALGYLMRHSATLIDALRVLVVHLELQDRAAVTLMLDPGGSQLALGYTLVDPGIAGRYAILDGALAMIYRLVDRAVRPDLAPALRQVGASQATVHFRIRARVRMPAGIQCQGVGRRVRVPLAAPPDRGSRSCAACDPFPHGRADRGQQALALR